MASAGLTSGDGIAGADSGPRRMLRRVRDVMAGRGNAQGRLDTTVEIIAHEYAAEVCSIYVRRPDQLLELFATEGLNRDAVHKTQLRFGEGLVGDIAQRGLPIALAEAQEHPKFAYRPETGEEAFHSLMGVPIRRLERVVGVLVVQHEQPRDYSEEEIESLEILAMVLAEVISSPAEVEDSFGRAERGPVRIAGLTVEAGMGVGKARLHQARTIIRRVVSEDADAENRRLDTALETMQGGLDRLMDLEVLSRDGEHREILETYQLIAKDSGWIAKIRTGISDGLTAEAAVQRVRDDTRARMKAVKDPYLRERLADFEDVAMRLLSSFQSEESAGTREVQPDEEFILVARSMGPAELLDYAGPFLKGLVLEESSAMAHVGIVARALDVPVIAKLNGLIGEVEAGDLLLVDGSNAQLFIRPGEEAYGQFRAAYEARENLRARYAALVSKPAVSQDGVTASLLMNAGLLVDVDNLRSSGAEGIGLYRTEIPFLVRKEFPSIEDQTELYARILDAAGGRPVTFRTLDAGGDKRLPSFMHEDEENPALGWRAIRIGLDYPQILRQQIRAMLSASRGRSIRIMFPMIATLQEFRQAREILDLELDRARRDSSANIGEVSVGAMVEVPSILLSIEKLAGEADFLSVGTNDLLQFLFASERGNHKMAGRFDTLLPEFLAQLRRIAEAANATNTPVTICGDMAGERIDALVLLALGFERLSMAPTAIGPVKEAILAAEIGAVRLYLDYWIERQEGSLRPGISAFLKERKS